MLTSPLTISAQGSQAVVCEAWHQCFRVPHSLQARPPASLLAVVSLCFACHYLILCSHRPSCSRQPHPPPVPSPAFPIYLNGIFILPAPGGDMFSHPWDWVPTHRHCCVYRAGSCVSTPSLITLVRLTSHCVLGGTYSQASSPLRSPEESKDLIQTKGSPGSVAAPQGLPQPTAAGDTPVSWEGAVRATGSSTCWVGAEKTHRYGSVLVNCPLSLLVYKGRSQELSCRNHVASSFYMNQI